MNDALPDPAVFRVGTADVKITPPLGVSLAGYFHDRKAESVRDDLFARALVIEKDGRRIAMVSCDIISMPFEISNPARQKIEKDTGIPSDHILLCATHTHTGPVVQRVFFMPYDEEYNATLPLRIAEAVSRAMENMTDVTLRVGRAQVEGYSFNRLFRMKDGSEHFGRGPNPDQAIASAGPIDPELQTLSAVDMDGNLRALAVNFALHPDVIAGGSGNFISADWPGMLADNIKALYGADTGVLFLQGTAGDINHVVHDPTHLPRSGPAKSMQLGRALAGAAMLAMERAEPMADGSLASILETIKIPYYTRDEIMRREVEALKQKAELTPFERYTIRIFEEWPHDGELADVPVHTMRIGELGLAAFPAEVFVKLGMEVKQYSPAKQTFVVELANGRVSTYIPTTDQAERGAYGAKPILSRHLCADAGRRIVDKATVNLHKLWQAASDS